jgi:hypothetical protein
MAPGNGIPRTREEFYRKVDELLKMQADYLTRSFKLMGFSQQQIDDEINFFMLRKAHYRKVADETLAQSAH